MENPSETVDKPDTAVAISRNHMTDPIFFY